jgi:hypothetical protein
MINLEQIVGYQKDLRVHLFNGQLLLLIRYAVALNVCVAREAWYYKLARHVRDSR